MSPRVAHFTISSHYFSSHCPMAPILYLILILTVSSSSSVEGQPSPGYYPSSEFSSLSFDQGFRNLWGPQHQRVDQGVLTIWLDRSSGIHKLSSILSFLSITTKVVDVFLFATISQQEVGLSHFISTVLVTLELPSSSNPVTPLELLHLSMWEKSLTRFILW